MTTSFNSNPKAASTSIKPCQVISCASKGLDLSGRELLESSRLLPLLRQFASGGDLPDVIADDLADDLGYSRAGLFRVRERARRGAPLERYSSRKETVICELGIGFWISLNSDPDPEFRAFLGQFLWPEISFAFEWWKFLKLHRRFAPWPGTIRESTYSTCRHTGLFDPAGREIFFRLLLNSPQSFLEIPMVERLATMFIGADLTNAAHKLVAAELEEKIDPKVLEHPLQLANLSLCVSAVNQENQAAVRICDESQQDSSKFIKLKANFRFYDLSYLPLLKKVEKYCGRKIGHLKFCELLGPLYANQVALSLDFLQRRFPQAVRPSWPHLKKFVSKWLKV